MEGGQEAAAETDEEKRQMAGGYYSRVLIDEPPTDLFFERVSGAPEPPEDLRQLKLDLEGAAQSVVTFFRDDAEALLNFMERLQLAGQVGCCGPDYRIGEGKDSLESTKRQVLQKGYESRNRIWFEYTRYTLAILLPTVVAGFAIFAASTYGIYLPGPDAKGNFPPLVVAVLAALWIPAGAAFGVWTEFNFRTGNLKFGDLLSFDPERWSSGQRFFIAVMIGYLLAFVLAFGVIQIGLLGVLLNDFTGSRPWLSGVVGWVSGFSYPVVRDIIKTLRPSVRQQSEQSSS